MPARVSRHLDDLEGQCAEIDLVAVGDGQVYPGNARDLGFWSDQRRARESRLQRIVAAGMIGMMVGVEDMGEGQPLPVQFGDRRGGVAGIDDTYGVAVRFA